ncbi:hypothetical protein ACFL04_00195 [Patescibacteria group bacterium]
MSKSSTDAKPSVFSASNLEVARSNGRYDYSFLEDLGTTEDPFPDIPQRRTSNFSELVVVSRNHEEVVLKSLLPNVLGPLDSESRKRFADELVGISEQFHNMLHQHNVALPVPMTLIVTKHGWTVLAMPYLGPDYDARIRLAHKNAPRLIRGILRSVSEVLQQPPPYRLGLDLRLTNFAGDPETQTCYVDTFPPLFSPDGIKYYVHLPNPESEDEIQAHIARKFDPRGSLRRFRFDLMAIDPCLEHVMMEELASAIPGALYREIGDYFRSLPDSGITPRTSATQVFAMIEKANPTDTDLFREIGARWIPTGDQRREALDAVWMALRTPGPGDPPHLATPAGRVKEFVRVLSSI